MLLKKSLEEITMRPLSHVAVIQSPENPTGEALFVFVKVPEGRLKDAIVLFHMGLEGYPEAIPQVSVLSELDVDVELERLKKAYVPTKSLREVLIELREGLKEWEGEQSAEVVQKTALIFQNKFSDVFIPTAETEELYETVERQQLDSSQSYLTASQLWLSMSLDASQMSLSQTK
jgi:hypothetical protein